MDDVRTLFVAILIDIVHIKLLCKKCIPLDRDHGVFFSVYVLCVDINLRSVESSLAHILCEWNVQLLKHLADMAFCLFPYLRLTDVFLFVCRIPFGKMIGYIFLNTKYLQTVLGKCDTVFELFYHLVRSYDQMSLGNSKLTNSCQAMHLSGILITEQCGGLAETDRQITVAVLLCFVYIVLERTCHRTKCINLFVLLLITKYEHTIFVMIPVSGDLVKIALCHKRSFCSYVSTLCLLILDPALKLLHHDHTVWHDKRKSLSDHIYSCEDLHLTAKLVMITSLCFFHLLQMLFQLILCSIGCYVDTCKHCVLLTASPVCAGRRKKFECLDAFYTHQVWACTEVCPVSL